MKNSIPWWAPVHKGLFTDSKHRERMGSAIWFYGFFLQCADRETGCFMRKRETIERETGISLRTIDRMIKTLSDEGYILVKHRPYSLDIQITKWRPITDKKRFAKNGEPQGLRVAKCGEPDSPKVANLSGKNDFLSDSKIKASSPRFAKNGEPNETLLNESKDIYTVFEFWNAQKIVEHRDISKFESTIKARLKYFAPEEIIQAVKNYKTVLDSPDHFFDYRWTLEEFLSRKGGLEKFMDQAEPLKNFLKRQSPGNGFKSQADHNSASSGKLVL